jgi:hypothetical protein
VAILHEVATSGERHPDRPALEHSGSTEHLGALQCPAGVGGANQSNQSWRRASDESLGGGDPPDHWTFAQPHVRPSEGEDDAASHLSLVEP